MKISKLLKVLNRIKKHPDNKLGGNLEVVISIDEEGNGFHNDLSFSWTKTDKSELGIFPSGPRIDL